MGEIACSHPPDGRGGDGLHAALREGKLQCEEWTHAESITTQGCVDALRGAVIRGAA